MHGGAAPTGRRSADLPQRGVGPDFAMREASLGGPLMLTRSRLHRGFTLLEVMAAVVILIILSALAATFMVYGMGRARMNNAVFDVAALINSAQLRAISRGTPHYIFIH